MEKGLPLCQPAIKFDLPTAESLLDPGKLLAELEFVVQREGKAILDVGSAMPYSVARILVGSALLQPLIALLGEVAGIC